MQDSKRFWISFPLGFDVVLPNAVGFSLYAYTPDPADAVTNSQTTRDEDAALETLRQRYAQGDLSDTEFEQRVERLLKTETSDHHHDSTTSNFE